MEAKLGDVIIYQGKPFRIVRTITQSYTLYEPVGKPAYITEESYIQLKGPKDEVEFVILNANTREYTGEPCTIKGLDPIGKEPL